MPDRTRNRREPPISYRPPASLRAEFYRRVKRSGLTVSGFITKAVFDRDPPRQARRPSDAQMDGARLLPPGAEIEEALACIEAQSGDDPVILAALERARRALGEIRALAFRLNGRRP